MLLRFWGTRGSIATPGSSTLRYGGNTSCVEAVTDAGTRFIFDCGTGARALGGYLLANGPKPLDATVLLSHTHWDHIQGFPFFAPLFIPGNRFTVCGPQGANSSLPEVLAGQMEFTYFPVELSQLGAQIEYRDLSEGAQDLSGVRVTAQFLNHPAIALGYRIEADGVSLLYLCDHEPYWESLWRSDAEPGRLESILHDGDRRHAAFMQNADVVIHDAQYTPEEYPAKKNWGHSTYSYVTQIAAAANVKRLFLTHHDPTHNDDFLDDVEKRSREIAASLHSPIRISCAVEGYEERIEPSVVEHPAVNEVAASDAGGGSLTILVIDDDEDLRVLVRKVLSKAGHRVLEAEGGHQGIQLIQSHSPDLILLDLFMPPPDGFEVLRMLRSRDETRSLPVVVLTAHGEEESARASFDLGATDFLAKPFTPPQLDARVRSCFVRAHAAKVSS
ncbi:MAG TPA: response regulator [Bryobacteraceae bacterium]|nr:response regulator [Bryobacteraceae bacterium]